MAEVGAVAVEQANSLYPLAIAAWRLRFGIDDQEIDLDLWLPRDFPWDKPRIVTAHVPAFPSLPHVEETGQLCLLPASAEWATNDPIGLVEDLIVKAHALLSDGMQGRNQTDFRNEARSYWIADNAWKPVKSLLRREGPSRPIFVWSGKLFTLVGDDKEELSDWLGHRFLGGKATPRTQVGLLCWLDQPPLPSDLPKTPHDLVDFLTAQGIFHELPKAIASSPNGVDVVIGFPASGGASFVALSVFPSRSGRPALYPNREWLIQGFRPHRVQKRIASHRFTNRARIARRTVERCDATWIHGRDANPDLVELRTARVALVGCGSLGSSVAKLLAQAGVGAFTLIDPETLTSANTGRHILGSESVGLFKAAELGRRLKADYPHIYEAIVANQGWQDAADAQPKLFDHIDLVISTVGSWATEGMLDLWLHDRKGRVVYGWVEPQAAGGHALLIDHSAGGGCLACGMSTQGHPLMTVTSWPTGMLVQEPACGAFFQPYGAVQLERGAVAVAELALDALLGRTKLPAHRAWAGSQRHLDQTGGAWAEMWTAATDGVQASRELELTWARSASCSVCAG